MNSMLAYKGYHALIEFDAADNIFVGEVFGIADSLNFHGTTVDELQENFKNCIEDYFVYCKSIDKEPDKEFKGSFNVRVSSETHKKAALEAAKQKITLNQYVAKAISYTISLGEGIEAIDMEVNREECPEVQRLRYALISKMIQERVQQGISVKEFAEKVGCSEVEMENIENGKSKPTLEFVFKSMHVLGKEVNIQFV